MYVRVCEKKRQEVSVWEKMCVSVRATYVYVCVCMCACVSVKKKIVWDSVSVCVVCENIFTFLLQKSLIKETIFCKRNLQFLDAYYVSMCVVCGDIHVSFLQFSSLIGKWIREREREYVCVCVCMCMCMYMCVREREYEFVSLCVYVYV